MKQKISCNIPVTMLASNWGGEIKNLPPNEVFTLIIDYPLEKEVKFSVKTGKKGLTLTKLLFKIGHLYEKIYSNEKYSHLIYGHDIEDLSLGEVAVDFDKKIITLGVNS